MAKRTWFQMDRSKIQNLHFIILIVDQMADKFFLFWSKIWAKSAEISTSTIITNGNVISILYWVIVPKLQLAIVSTIEVRSKTSSWEILMNQSELILLPMFTKLFHKWHKEWIKMFNDEEIEQTANYLKYEHRRLLNQYIIYLQIINFVRAK